MLTSPHWGLESCVTEFSNTDNRAVIDFQSAQVHLSFHRCFKEQLVHLSVATAKPARLKKETYLHRAATISPELPTSYT